MYPTCCQTESATLPENVYVVTPQSLDIVEQFLDMATKLHHSGPSIAESNDYDALLNVHVTLNDGTPPESPDDFYSGALALRESLVDFVQELRAQFTLSRQCCG